jgi:membrane protein YdbS with pleckstrin-like domain
VKDSSQFRESAAVTQQAADPFDPASITRPEPALMTYYAITAAMTFVGFPLIVLRLYFKYHTLRYRFDDKGIAMSYGILFRREVYLTYRRIQDIHVTRNFIQRWLGLASVAVQTASGSSGAQMTIEGIREPERLRDFLYRQMRGAHGEHAGGPERDDGAVAPAVASAAGGDEALMLLREIRDEIRRWRAASRPGAGA